MALSNQGFNDRVLSPPCKVFFAGWESTTTRLQQLGWSLSAEQDQMRRRLRLALRFEPCKLYMMSEATEYDIYQAYGPGGMHGYSRLPEFHVRDCASNFHIQMMGDLSLFRPIDATPQYIRSEIKSIEDFNLFATPLVRTQEIIVEPETVSSLMEQIRKLQVTDLEAIRKRRSRQEGSSAPMPAHQFHAQILSLAA
jgi:hypothetical protein